MCTTCVNLSCFGRLGHSCSYNTGGPGTIHPKSARCPLFAELQSECACRGAHRRGTKRSRVSDFEAARAAMVFWAAVPRMLDRTDMAVCQNLVPLVNIKIAGKWMFIPLKMVLIGIDPYPYELMTCSLLTKMEQDGTRSTCHGIHRLGSVIHHRPAPNSCLCQPRNRRVGGYQVWIPPLIPASPPQYQNFRAIRSISCMWRPPIPSKISQSPRNCANFADNFLASEGVPWGMAFRICSSFRSSFSASSVARPARSPRLPKFFKTLLGALFLIFWTAFQKQTSILTPMEVLFFSTSSDHHQPFDHGIMTHLSWILPLPCPGTDCNLPFGAALRADGSCAVKASHFRRIWLTRIPGRNHAPQPISWFLSGKIDRKIQKISEL